MPASSPKSASKFYQAVGRRKQAIARVRLTPNKDVNADRFMVNSKPVGAYFDITGSQYKYDLPLTLTNTKDRFVVSVKVSGSGKASQLDAVIHGIARALIKVDEEFRPTLKQHGLLTRDPRKKQRRMIGKGGKARATKQSPKR